MFFTCPSTDMFSTTELASITLSLSTCCFCLTQSRSVNHGGAGPSDDDKWVLEVDLGAFRRGLPHMRRTKTIGQGVDFLNRHLSSSLSRDPANGGINGSLFQYLKTLTYAGACCRPDTSLHVYLSPPAPLSGPKLYQSTQAIAPSIIDMPG
jgi:hypothetical protein